MRLLCLGMCRVVGSCLMLVKMVGDYVALARGAPVVAPEAANRSIELLRVCFQTLWCAVFIRMACVTIESCSECGAFLIVANSVDLQHANYSADPQGWRDEGCRPQNDLLQALGCAFDC